MVFTGQQNTCGPGTESDATVPPAADVCCGYMNFFTTAASAAAWASAHPEVTGQTLSQKDAVKTAARIFGPLLRTGL